MPFSRQQELEEEVRRRMRLERELGNLRQREEWILAPQMPGEIFVPKGFSVSFSPRMNLGHLL